MLRLHMLLAALALSAGAMATPQAKPEIERAVGTAQAVDAVHVLRNIPEACARLEGRFTGDAAKPYAFAAVRSGARCQARARLVDAKVARPSAQSGWILNDVIRVPNAACPAQQAVVTVWRKPAGAAVPPRRDAQGRSRIYLKEGLDKARAGDLDAIPAYAAGMVMEGGACN